MNTTIQISDQTHRRLRLLKESTDKSSYDQILQDILKEHLTSPKTMAGAFPGLLLGENSQAVGDSEANE